MIAKMLSDFIAQKIDVRFINDGDYLNAEILLRDDVAISVGDGPSHYSNNRFDYGIDPTVALLSARTAETLVYRRTDGVILESVKGWQSTMAVRALVRKWS